jgi:hypothetical protein
MPEKCRQDYRSERLSDEKVLGSTPSGRKDHSSRKGLVMFVHGRHYTRRMPRELHLICRFRVRLPAAPRSSSKWIEQQKRFLTFCRRHRTGQMPAGLHHHLKRPGDREISTPIRRVAQRHRLSRSCHFLLPFIKNRAANAAENYNVAGSNPARSMAKARTCSSAW